MRRHAPRRSRNPCSRAATVVLRVAFEREVPVLEAVGGFPAIKDRLPQHAAAGEDGRLVHEQAGLLALRDLDNRVQHRLPQAFVEFGQQGVGPVGKRLHILGRREAEVDRMLHHQTQQGRKLGPDGAVGRVGCQIAWNRDPHFAPNRDPFEA